MAQHDYNIANQTGANFRTDLNNALLAISSNNSGSSEPSTMYAYEWWIDTSANVLKLRNSSNNAWITMPFSITADNTVDINAGTVNGITSLSFSSGATVTSILDEDDFSSDSATALATQQSIKAYIASQITLEDLDITDGSSSISIDLDSETLSLLGGTGVTSAASGNGVTFSIGQSVGTSDNVVFNQVTGALVGNASTATALATARTISGVSFDGTANITLDTDDIGEGSSNKYFTNERVDDQVNTLLTAGANISLTYDDAAGTLTIANTNTADITSVIAGDGLTGGGTAGDVTLAVGVDDSSIEINSDALRVKATGITNAMLAGSIANSKLANSSITVNSQAIALGGSHTFDTDDIGEGSSNLYFTNERTDDRVAALIQNGTGISFTYNDSAGTLTPVITLSPFDTDNLSEGSSNLYYTDTRANSAIDARVTNTFINNLSGVVADTATALATGRTIGLSGDVTATGVSFDGTGNITLSTTIAANSVALGTDTTGNYVATIADAGNTRITVANSGSETAAITLDIADDAIGTDQLANNAVTLGTQSTGNYVATVTGTTNEIEVSGSGSETATVTIGLPDDVTIAGNLTVNGTTTTVNSDTLSVTDPLIKLAKANSGADSLDIGFYGLYDTSGSQDLYAGLFRDANDSGKFKLFKDLQVEPTTTVNTSGTGYAVGTLVSNLEGNVTGQVSTLSNHDTDNLSEGSSNLYFTNARSRSAISASGDISYNSSTGVISFTQSAAPVTSVNSATGAVTLDTDDIGEGSSNLYFTNARADTRINLQTGSNLDLSSKSTSNLSEGTNLYYTDTRFDTRLGTKTTDNLTEGSSNLYMTTERVQDIVGGMVTGNTETGITVTYDDSDGTLDFVVGTLNQDTTGNAATATALQTARNIGGVSFDGTGNIDLAGVNTSGNQDTSGNAATATALATGRNFSITGDITASAVSFDGTGNVALSAGIDANTVGISELNVSDGSNGQVLTTDGAGNLSFSTASGTTINNNADNRVITGSGTANTLNGESGLTYDGSALSVTGTINGVGISSNITNFSTSILISNDAGTGTLDAASNNTGLGWEVFDDLTSGDDNAGFGKQALTKLTTGSNNIAMGTLAMFTNTTGNNNTALGHGALYYNTTASNNTGLGYAALQANTTGTQNTAVGSLSLDANTTGNYNTAVGYDSLTANTTASENTAVGFYCMRVNTEGTRNVAMGYNTLAGNTTANNNTAIGHNAMASNSTGYDNVAVGRIALDHNTDGHSNTAVGESSLTSNTTGDRNVAIGQNAMGSNTTGSENVAIGRNALDANTTASENVAVGDGALTACTTGAGNVAIGHSAGAAIDTGSQNVCIGENAGDGLNGDNGKWNVAIGLNALSASSTHFQNTAVGQNALNVNAANANSAFGSNCLASNTGGSGNNGFGYFTLNECTTGDDNAAFGTAAGRYITSGGGNTCMGNQAGQDLTTGDTNTLIGRRTGQNITTADNNTAMGVDAMEDATTAFDNTCIGSNAGANLTSGSNNLLLGKAAGKSGSPGGQRTTHSNRIGLGDGNITTFSCQVSLSVASDERDKTDFSDLDIGLDFVNKLKPYTYKWDKRHKYVNWTSNPDTDLNSITHDGSHKEDWLDIGFKAQDVELLEKEAGYDKDNNTNLTIDLSDDGKQYSMKYEKLVPILVKAVQELSSTVDELKNEITTLKGE